MLILPFSTLQYFALPCAVSGIAGEDDSSEDDDDDDLEAAQLEKMVAKLSRIVKHVMPKTDMEIDENMDKGTSNWLSQVR
jgi:hypothetical protein